MNRTAVGDERVREVPHEGFPTTTAARAKRKSLEGNKGIAVQRAKRLKGRINFWISPMFTYALPCLFTPSECGEIITLSEGRSQDSGGLVGGVRQGNIRRATISWLDDEGPAAWVMRRIMEAVAQANRELFDFDINEFRERLQVARYDDSEAGHYDWHSDIGEGRIAQFRKATIVTQLSPQDAYEGGGLEINLGNRIMSASRDQGSAVVFASFMLHRVVPVTKGTRTSLTCWSHGPRFR